MQILIILCLLLSVGYVVLMAVYRRGWLLQKEFVLPEGFIPSTTISVIIPARNEAANIGECIRSVLAQHYPRSLLEVIVVDDHSTDETAAIVTGYAHENVRCIPLTEHINSNEHINAFKKKALATGILLSEGELIVTTDADCTAPANWLLHIAAIYERQRPVMIVAPVAFTSDNSVVANFQVIDFMSMQGITVAANRLQLGNMCNGANLAFSRAAYNAVNGYAGIDHLASGDDYLLMMKLQKAFPGKVACLKAKDAIVSTPPQPGWRSFMQQRIRWASKSGKYDDPKLTRILIMVYLYNLSFLVIFVAAMFHPVLLWLLVAMLIIKIAGELSFLLSVARFFKKTGQIYLHPLLQPLHIGYIILAGFMGFFGGYQWKGRKVR